jgi:N-acetylglucosamine malate deacetylase 1
MSCDLLVFAPHPDDAEIHFGASIAHQTQAGQRVVVVDASRGEMGSRGTPKTRAAEAMAAAEILGLHARENLALPDGFLSANDPTAREGLIAAIRRWQPALIIGPNPHALHPDHQALATLMLQAVKAAELHHMPPTDQSAWRGARLLAYEGELPVTPQLVLACTEADWERKLAAIGCYGSQLHQPGSHEPETSIAQAGFLRWVESRGRAWGHQVGTPYAEALTAPLTVARITDLACLMTKH